MRVTVVFSFGTLNSSSSIWIVAVLPWGLLWFFYEDYYCLSIRTTVVLPKENNVNRTHWINCLHLFSTRLNHYHAENVLILTDWIVWPRLFDYFRGYSTLFLASTNTHALDDSMCVCLHISNDCVYPEKQSFVAWYIHVNSIE